jgi:sugar/nucleoside kinase (ribokinase family)
MNFWIESRRPDIVELIKHVDLITLNDGEARQLTDCANLVKASRWIMERGPKMVIIKKGEHGAFLFKGRSIFFAPAYPLEEVFDPTGAGDSFAGGFMGYLAAHGRGAEQDHGILRSAMTYGSVMASFNVEDFGTERVQRLTRDEVDRRFDDFRTMTALPALSAE